MRRFLILSLALVSLPAFAATDLGEYMNQSISNYFGGKTDTATQWKLFTDEEMTRNASCWGAALDWSGFIYGHGGANSGITALDGSDIVMITPKHGMLLHHAGLAEYGTNEATNQWCRARGADGTYYTNHVAALTYFAPAVENDMAIVTFSSNFPAAIHPYPILPLTYSNLMVMTNRWLVWFRNNTGNLSTTRNWTTNWGNGAAGFHGGSDVPGSSFNANAATGGDSGSPFFFILGTNLVLVGTLTDSALIGPFISSTNNLPLAQNAVSPESLTFVDLTPYGADAPATNYNFYISTTGNDSNTGTLASPLATLAGAQTKMQTLTHPLTNRVNVYLRGGRYYQTNTFALSGSQDSGTPTYPVVYQSYPGETAIVIGGSVVTNFQAVTNAYTLGRLTAPAQAAVLQADLWGQGITNLGSLNFHGYGHTLYDQQPVPYQSELLFQDVAMTLARWPNTGSWSNTLTPVTATSFTYAGTKPAGWADLTDIWVRGYWYYDYADSWEKVASIDTVNKTVTETTPGPYSAYKDGARFYWLNILEELDSAGEYYIDRTNGMLYFWPPNSITNGACIVTLPDHIITTTGVSNVTFLSLTFEGSKDTILEIDGGRSNVVSKCTFRGGSTAAVKILASQSTGVTRSYISDMGERGIWIYGSGNRSNLVSGDNWISHNTISNIGRLSATYKPAIDLYHTYYLVYEQVDGVYMGYNSIHDCPHFAIQFFGNNHTIEHNEIYRVCTESADAGAIYASYDWTFRGNVIRNNYLHDIHRGGGATDYTGVIGVYLDALLCGTSIYSNIFCAVDHGILVNGGRDNFIWNNFFIDGTNTAALASYAIDVAQIGKTWWASEVTDTNSTTWTRLRAMPFQTAPWSSQYPQLVTLPDNDPGATLNNWVTNNISYNNQAWMYWEGGAQTNGTTVLNNLTNSDPKFVDYGGRNFVLQPDSPALAMGINQIVLTFGPQAEAAPSQPSTVGNLRVNKVIWR